jgi:hypothetical protein
MMHCRKGRVSDHEREILIYIYISTTTFSKNNIKLHVLWP